jgi:hypothetical protein
MKPVLYEMILKNEVDAKEYSRENYTILNKSSKGGYSACNDFATVRRGMMNSECPAIDVTELLKLSTRDRIMKKPFTTHDIYHPFNHYWLEYALEDERQAIRVRVMDMEGMEYKVDSVRLDGVPHSYEINEGYKYVMDKFLGNQHRIIGPMYSIEFCVNKDGSLNENFINPATGNATYNMYSVHRSMANLIRNNSGEFGPTAELVRFVSAFLSCKNIKLLSNPIIFKRGTRSVESKYKCYELVVVKPGKQHESSYLPEDQKKGCRPLHMCRGHLAHYTEEHPLFGLYPGTFYIPAHVRGDIKNGEIKKTYSLKAGVV